MKPSEQCYKLIKQFEGLRLSAYKDPAGIWTIGYGCTFYRNRRRVKKGDKITLRRAESLLVFVVDDFAALVDQLIIARMSQNQFNALVSFAYNVGLDIDDDAVAEGFGDSKLLKLVNKNPYDRRIDDEFLKWNKATINGRKVVLPGLTTRRQAEVRLYNTVQPISQ